MQDSVTTWDLRSIPPESNSAEKLLALFFIVVIVVTAVKLIRIWRAAPPFLLSRQTGSESLARQLRDSARSLSEWMNLVLLSCPFLICFNLYRESSSLQASRSISSTDVVYLLRNGSSLGEMGLASALLLFIARWHLLRRLESVKGSLTSR